MSAVFPTRSCNLKLANFVVAVLKLLKGGLSDQVMGEGLAPGHEMVALTRGNCYFHHQPKFFVVDLSSSAVTTSYLCSSSQTLGLPYQEQNFLKLSLVGYSSSPLICRGDIPKPAGMPGIAGGTRPYTHSFFLYVRTYDKV